MKFLGNLLSELTKWLRGIHSHVIGLSLRCLVAPVPSRATESKDELAAMLRGQKMFVPNIAKMLSNLATGPCDHYEQLEARINSRLDEILIYPEARKKADKINLPFFISVWFPHCGLLQQEAMALYNMWLFIWDDVFDGEDNKNIPPMNMVDMFERTIAYVHYHLGLDEGSVQEPEPPTWATSLFKHAGKLITVHASLAQRQRFFAEIQHYIKSCEDEQKVLDKNVLPTIKEYWTFRWGTSSVFTSCALTDFMASVELPVEILDTEELRALWIEVNRNVILINDVLSLKKEIHGSLNSLAPITMMEMGKTLNASIKDIVAQLQLSIESFSALSKRLIAMVEHDAHATHNVTKYIRLLQYNITGNYIWSIECKRYNIAKYLQPDGSFLVQL